MKKLAVITLAIALVTSCADSESPARDGSTLDILGGGTADASSTADANNAASDAEGAGADEDGFLWA